MIFTGRRSNNVVRAKSRTPVMEISLFIRNFDGDKKRDFLFDELFSQRAFPASLGQLPRRRLRDQHKIHFLPLLIDIDDDAHAFRVTVDLRAFGKRFAFAA